MSRLRIRLTRLNSTHHRFEAVRPDGGGEALELETRSFFTHDLLHFVVESEAGLADAFYGKLARGEAYDLKTVPLAGEAAETEAVVGPLQTAIKGDVDAEAFVARLAECRRLSGAEPIAWLTADMVTRAVKRLRELEGRWRATKFGGTMELVFSPEQ